MEEPRKDHKDASDQKPTETFDDTQIYTNKSVKAQIPIKETHNSRNLSMNNAKANTNTTNHNKLKIRVGKIAGQTMHRRRKNSIALKKEFKLKKELLKDTHDEIDASYKPKSGENKVDLENSHTKHNRSVSEKSNQNGPLKIHKRGKSRFSSLHQSISESYSNCNFDKSQTCSLSNNLAGPGSYNLPSLLGNISMEATKKNDPVYSIGTQSKKKLLILCKDQAMAVKGSSSPGVGTYSGDLITLKGKSPNATIGRERRFLANIDRKNNNSAHCYDSLDRESIKANGNKTNGFSKELRFLADDKALKEKQLMPSCQTYNHSFYGTIQERSQKIVPHSRNDSFKQSLDKFSVKTYFKELEKGYCSKEGPGPAAYCTNLCNTLSKFQKSVDGSFPKADRGIKRYNTKKYPGPSDYDTKTAYQNLNLIRGAATIGKSRRNIDMTRMTSLHSKELCGKY
ncbi:unnamed protein product [Moneuplotes crassus]|uniref:Uncharacterized protein n=1 Tax=Euplotes crassus TaxID=5936 RepID=A0AAD1UE37_EUPCR|nr:unnamed protein product [Moneuplotes crassus]